MKNLLSHWSGRLMFLLIPASLIASFLVPANVLAKVFMSNGGGSSGGTEGDPLDTNDYGGGSGGGDVHDQGGALPPSDSYIIELERFQILLIPEHVGGTLTFRIMVVEKTDRGFARRSTEGTHAP
jgi:hypothetical protein